MRFVESTFVKTSVVLDNNEYIRCIIQDCAVIYGGNGPVTLQGCTFINVRFQFVGHASMTVDFLRAIYHGFGGVGRQLVEQVFGQIQASAPPVTATATPSAEPAAESPDKSVAAGGSQR